MNKARDPVTDNRPDGAAGAPAPNVLQVLPALASGGVERGTIEIAGAVVAAGGTAVVASSGGPMERDLERAGATHVTLPVDRKGPLAVGPNARRLADLVRKYDIDVIHARSRAPAWAARRAARRTGRAFVTTFHGTYNFKTPIKKLYNAIMTKGDRVIAISEFIADHIRRHYKIDPDRLTVVPRGVDLALFDPSVVPGARVIKLSEEWRLPDGVPVVMLPGRLTRWKGQRLLLEALTRIDRRDFIAVLVGDEGGRVAYRAELEGFVNKNGLQSVVRFAGHSADMPAAFMLADVVVSASTDPEAFGRVVVEAQAMGRPVIAPDHGGGRETVRNGETGWLFRPGDPVALAGALERALDIDPPTRQRMADAAIENVKQHYSKELMCARTLEIYREVVRSKRRHT